MNKTDRAVWASARTLADLCELTACWIEGAIASQPGYHGPSDIEDPAMIPVLARLNRAGFMTTGSQQGLAETGYDGAWWEQRAAVDGFAGSEWLTRRLCDAAQDADLPGVAYDPAELPRWRYRYRSAFTVTLRAGQSRTRFGVHLPRRHIRDSWIGYGICHPDAVKALCAAWQVTLIDPEWGRDSLLWPVLDEAVAGNLEGRPAPRRQL